MRTEVGARVGGARRDATRDLRGQPLLDELRAGGRDREGVRPFARIGSARRRQPLLGLRVGRVHALARGGGLELGALHEEAQELALRRPVLVRSLLGEVVALALCLGAEMSDRVVERALLDLSSSDVRDDGVAASPAARGRGYGGAGEQESGPGEHGAKVPERRGRQAAWHPRRVRQVVLIVNPFASGVTEELVAAVERALGSAAEVRTLLTERPGHAVELSEGACGDGVDAIVVFSGDGGYNEAANGADGHVPLGFVPGGGTSVLARALGLPREPVAAARALADAIEHERSRRITVGRVNGRRFTFTAGIGLDAELVRRVDAARARGRRAPAGRPRLRRPGGEAPARAARALRARARGVGTRPRGVRSRRELRPVHLRGRNASPGRRPRRASSSGSTSWRRARSGRETSRGCSRTCTTGRASLRGEHVAYAHDLDRIEIVCDRPLPLQADGEDLGDVEHAELEAEREALPVLV